MNKIAMVMAPHPDDAEFYAGGLIGSLSESGYQLIIVTATDGCCGSYSETRDQLIQTRQKEAEEAASVFSARVIMLGYHDYELDTLTPGELREKLVRLIRQHKPEISISIDPFAGNETHPDHRALAWAASDAINHAGLPLVYPIHKLEGLDPHFISEKYYYSEDFSIHNKIVDITPYMDKKLEAMRAHASQVSFLVEDFFLQAKIAGIDLESKIGPAINDPFLSLSYAILTQAGKIGQRAGFTYGESYRFTRFHPFIEELLRVEP